MKSAAPQHSEILPWKDPAHASIPQIRQGELGAVYYGQRQSGDFYDFIRCSPERVLFGLFDVAGDLEQARPIMVAMQKKLRKLSAELLSDNSINEDGSDGRDVDPFESRGDAGGRRCSPMRGVCRLL